MVKFVTVFCVLLLAYGAQCLSFSDISQSITSVVTAAVSKAEEKSEEVFDAITKGVDEGTTAMNKMATAMDNLLAEYIAAFEKTAVEIKDDLSSCANVTSEEMESVAKSLQANATSCVSTWIDALKTYDAEGKALVSNFTSEVARLNATTTSCWTTYSSSSGFSLTAFATLSACIAEVQVTVATSFTTSFTTMLSNMAVLLAKATEANLSLAACDTSSAITEYKAYLNGLETSFEKCVAELSS